MDFQGISYRFLKLLVVAWLATLLTGGGLLLAVIAAVVTWLVIRSGPPDNFEIISKPTAAMLFVISALGIGSRYEALRGEGLESGGAFIQANLSPSGAVMLIAILGLIFAPRYPPTDTAG